MARASIEIKGLDAIKRGLSELGLQQYPYAMASALNDISGMVQRGERQAAQRDFDQPTPYTLNALKINYANKRKLEGGVVFTDPPRLSESQHYLYPQVYGVRRGYKKFEAALYARGLLPAGHYAVPGKDAPRDAYGNVPAAKVVEMLSWFQAYGDKGYKANMTAGGKAKRKAGTKKRYGYEYFNLRRRQGKMPAGIYKRTYTPWGAASTLMYLYVPRSQTWYAKALPYHEIGKQIFNQHFRQSFGVQLDRALQTALAR